MENYSPAAENEYGKEKINCKEIKVLLRIICIPDMGISVASSKEWGKN